MGVPAANSQTYPQLTTSPSKGLIPATHLQLSGLHQWRLRNFVNLPAEKSQVTEEVRAATLCAQVHLHYLWK